MMDMMWILSIYPIVQSRIIS